MAATAMSGYQPQQMSVSAVAVVVAVMVVTGN